MHRQQQRVIFPVIGEELIALFGEMWGGANVNGGESPSSASSSEILLDGSDKCVNYASSATAIS